jgi:predicted permease
VIGVLDRAFQFTYPESTEIWANLPWKELETEDPNSVRYQTVGRLQIGRTSANAEADLNGINQILARDIAAAYKGLRIRVETVHEYSVGRARPLLTIVVCAAVLLLIVAFISAGAILATDTALRASEVSIRSGLGAQPAVIRRELCIDALMVFGIAAVTAFAVTMCVAPIIHSSLPLTVPRALDASLHPWFLVTTVVSMIVPIAAAYARGHSRALDVAPSLAAASSGDKWATRLNRTLLTLQVTAATVLLLLGGGLLRTLWSLQTVELGFDSRNLLAAELRLVGSRYRSSDAIHQLESDILSRISAVPGVIKAAATSAVPFGNVDWIRRLSRPDGLVSIFANERQVGWEFFDVMQIPIRHGRGFTRMDDDLQTTVAVVSESFAQDMFGEDAPIGLELSPNHSAVVVGVVPDLRYVRPGAHGAPAYYLLRSQTTSESLGLVVRTHEDNAHVGATLKEIVKALDPHLPPPTISFVDERVTRSNAEQSYMTVIAISFSVAGLILAFVGIQGVTAQVVRNRTRELAIRMTLGLAPNDLYLFAIRQLVKSILLGLTFGVVASLALERVFEHYNELPPITANYVVHATVLCFLFLMATGTSYFACRQTINVDVSSSLR